MGFTRQKTEFEKEQEAKQGLKLSQRPTFINSNELHKINGCSLLQLGDVEQVKWWHLENELRKGGYVYCIVRRPNVGDELALPVESADDLTYFSRKGWQRQAFYKLNKLP